MIGDLMYPTEQSFINKGVDVLKIFNWGCLYLYMHGKRRSLNKQRIFTKSLK